MESEVILVPVDGSSSSMRAVEFAITLAEATLSRIEFLSVVDAEGTMENLSPENISAHHSALEMAMSESQIILNDALEMVPKGIEARARCVSGSAAKSIVKAAQEDKCSMVVMGTRGLGAITAALLGSVSSYVLQHTDCPVTLVKAEADSGLGDWFEGL